jgi:autophagy-related protein 9
MTSNPFSKLVPTTHGRSFYEDLRRREEDTEDQAGLLDEENLNQNFHDYDLEHAELGVEESRTTLGGVTSPTGRGHGRRGGRQHRDSRSSWIPQEVEDGDNDVPASLLVECNEGDTQRISGRPRRSRKGKQPAAVPGPSKARSQWETAQAQQRLHDDDVFGPRRRDNGLPTSLFSGMVAGNARKKAEWKWANVSNLDIFIKNVYDYYLGNGMWCILTDRALHLV